MKSILEKCILELYGFGVWYDWSGLYAADGKSLVGEKSLRAVHSFYVDSRAFVWIGTLVSEWFQGNFGLRLSCFKYLGSQVAADGGYEMMYTKWMNGIKRGEGWKLFSVIEDWGYLQRSVCKKEFCTNSIVLYGAEVWGMRRVKINNNDDINNNNKRNNNISWLFPSTKEE